MNPRDTSGCSQNPSQITKSRRLGESKSRRPFFRSLLEGLELRYWKALAQPEESEVEELWKDKAMRKALAAADKKFENALYDAVNHDLLVSSASPSQYLKALDDIKSFDGVQLQAIVFAAATKFKELTPL